MDATLTGQLLPSFTQEAACYTSIPNESLPFIPASLFASSSPSSARVHILSNVLTLSCRSELCVCQIPQSRVKRTVTSGREGPPKKTRRRREDQEPPSHERQCVTFHFPALRIPFLLHNDTLGMDSDDGVKTQTLLWRNPSNPTSVRIREKREEPWLHWRPVTLIYALQTISRR